MQAAFQVATRERLEQLTIRQVTAEGLVVMAITQGSAMQSLLSNHRIDAGQILAVVRALLLPSAL